MWAWVLNEWDQVQPNLVAAGITGVLAWLWARRKLKHHVAAQEKRHRELLESHERLLDHLGVTDDDLKASTAMHADRSGLFAE